MITPYQYDEMLKKSFINGVKSFVIVLFASYRKTFIFNLSDIDDQVKSGGPKSLNIKKQAKWNLPYIYVETIESRKQLLDYDFNQALKIF